MEIKKLRKYSILIILLIGFSIPLSTPVFAWSSSGKKNQESDSEFEDQWTLVHDGRELKAYPDLREYVWEKVPNQLPNGPYDKIGVRRVVKEGIEPEGVIFLCPGVGGSAEQMISNPVTDTHTAYENYSLSLYLANRNFDVYAIDYRTHTIPIYLEADVLSFMADWGWEQWISDIKESVDLAKEVSGEERIYIAGQSFGGGAAMYFASLYWEEDLKGILLLDGGTGAKYPENVDNAYNLPDALTAMNEAGSWSSESGPYVQFLLFMYADLYPNAPASWGGVDLQPINNPFTGQPWDDITAWAAFMIYMAWGPGGVSNIYGGFGNARVLIHHMTSSDRHWPRRLGLESGAIADWDDCPFVPYDFDDYYSEIDVPLIAFKGDPSYHGSVFRHGIANPDFKGIGLPGFGHLDVYVGEYSEEKVKAPIYEWMMSRRMLVGSGFIFIDGKRFFGTSTIYINKTVIDFKIDGVRIPWDIDDYIPYKKHERYIGTNDFGRIGIFILDKGLSKAYGRKVHFKGSSM